MKIKREQFIRFLWDFDVNKKFPNQRLGQAFMNHFGITGTDAKLFYSEDEGFAIREYIKDKYIFPESTS